MFQDTDGFIWFATFNGISIYDGHKFINHTADNGRLTDNIVFGFFQKGPDEVWVIENSVTDVFVKRTRVRSIPIRGFELSNYIECQDVRTLVSRDKYVYEIRNGIPVQIAKFPHYFNNIYEAGNYFLIQSDSLLIVDKTFNKIIDAIPGRIFKDRSNRFWVLDKNFFLLDTAALNNGAFVLQAASFNLSTTHVSADHIQDFLADADGFFWLFVENKGVLRIDAEGGTISYNFTRQYLDHVSFTEDAEGNVWVPGKGGVIKFSNKYVDVYSADRGLTSDFVCSIAADEENSGVWAALRKGICCIYRDSIYNFRYPTDYFSWTTVMIQHDSLWVCLDKLYLYRVKYYPHPKLTLLRVWSPGVVPYVMITCLRQDKKGAMLVAIDDDGLYRLSMNGKIEKVYDDIWTFLIDGDELWTGTKFKGAAKWKMIYEGDSLRLKLLKRYEQLKDDHVRSIVKDQSGNFWMARLKKGVTILERQHGDSFIVREYNFKQGLSNGWVLKNYPMSNGAIYTATLGGLFELCRRKDSLYFESLSTKYGINTEVYDIAHTSPNDLWLASDVGIIHLRNELYSPAKPPRVYFTQMLLNNKPDSSIYRGNVPAVYSYAENSLMFAFSATSFRNENQVLYSYKLDKSQEASQWSVPEHIHSVSLVSLSPGSYTLNVKAITADNIESDWPARFSFVINEPFWSAWWFRVAGVITFLSVLYGFYKFRLGQMRKVLTVRTKISRDLHDEIGSTLSGIGLISELAKQQLDMENYAGAKQSVEKISSGSEEILGKMGDIVWTINPENDSFEKMLIRLKSYTTSVATPLNIAIHFEGDRELQKINLNMQQRNNLYMICKEAINNAIKYSSCSVLHFSVRNFDNSLHIEIGDNGKGFDVNGIFDGNGLKNMQFRAKEINGMLRIVSERGRGTSLILQLRTI